MAIPNLGASTNCCLDFLNGNFIEIGNSDGNTLARITRTSDTTKKIGVTQKRAWAVGAGIQTDIGSTYHI
jgi:hypothetical protein